MQTKYNNNDNNNDNNSKGQIGQSNEYMIMIKMQYTKKETII